MYVGASADEETKVQDGLNNANLIHRTRNAMLGSEGRARYCGVWGRPPGVAIRVLRFRDQSEGNFEQIQASYGDLLLLDIAVSGASKPQPIRERARADLQSEDSDLHAIRDDPAFTEVMKAGHRDRRYTAVWNGDASFESTSIYGLDPSAHLRKCQELVAQGYRPVSWSASQTKSDGPLVTASVWHRPAVKEESRDQLAVRQARAAVALVTMGRAGEIMPLLKHSADPRLRSFIVNWLSPHGADPMTIAAEFERLDSLASRHPRPAAREMDAILFHPQTSMRRALILALGTYGAERLSPGERGPLTGKLLDLYRDDPDSGIHGAVEWTLRQWKQQEKLKELEAKFKPADRGERRWYVNGQGQTYAVIEGPVIFNIGSPPTETERIAGNEAPSAPESPAGSPSPPRKSRSSNSSGS